MTDISDSATSAFKPLILALRSLNKTWQHSVVDLRVQGDGERDGWKTIFHRYILLFDLGFATRLAKIVLASYSPRAFSEHLTTHKSWYLNFFGRSILKGPTVSVKNVLAQTEICPLSPFNVDVYGFECKTQPVNATLKGGKRRGMFLIAWMRFTCCSSKEYNYL